MKAHHQHRAVVRLKQLQGIQSCGVQAGHGQGVAEVHAEQLQGFLVQRRERACCFIQGLHRTAPVSCCNCFLQNVQPCGVLQQTSS